VVKQLSYSSQDTQSLQIARRLFKKEAEILEKLGQHDKIPTLLAEFEENEEFYLVQQFIDGYPLNQEILPGQPWNEDQVIRLLTEVLEILIFVHGQGVVHRDIKPANLMRRSADDKLVLIDFGAVKEIGTQTPQGQLAPSVAVGTLQYMPIEQLQGHPQFNSDIYALGMIAIQALTGQAPLQLNIDTYTNEIVWRSDNIPVNDYLAAILSQMIRYDFQYRFQSAAEVLRILKQMVWENKLEQIIEAHNQLYIKPRVVSSDINKSSTLQKSSPLLTGMKVGLAANGLLMGLGVYSLLHNSSPSSGTETLYQATKEYQSGDLQEALALARDRKSVV
jgi:serine/threonine protein kinase